MKPHVEMRQFAITAYSIIKTALTEIKQHRDLYYLPRYRPLFKGDEDEEHKQNRIANYQKSDSR